MPYEDKELDRLFPTRVGESIGTDNERTMLDNINGANQIRTSIRLEETDTCKTTIRLRTRAGHPDFIVEKECSGEESQPVYMDSGIVDLLSIAPYNPLTLVSAPLYYGSIQRAYFALKKLLGKIIPPSILTTTPPPESVAGRSFLAERGDLVGKKDCAAKCPASMFTGKARLYAQALYGNDLINWKWTLDIPDGLSPRMVHDNGAVLNINSGIYIDDKYTHWLITIYPDGIRITKLVRDKRVEPLIAKLKDPACLADHKKIEAYILAYSTPSSTMTFALDVSVPTTDMLGYGWKFNWDGSRADIIQHVESSPVHTSTHFRFSFNRNSSAVVPGNLTLPEQEATRWTVGLSIVEGPVTWHNSKFSQTIASPDWLTNTLAIFGTLYGGAVGMAVPIYCFYKDDGALEIFRYTVSGGTGGTRYMVTSEPAAWMYPVDWTAENIGNYTPFGSSGLQGAEGERRVRSFSPTTTGFYCGVASGVASSQSYTFSRYTLSAKTIVANGPTWTSSNVGHNAFEHTCAANDTGWSPYYVTTDGVQRYTSGTEIINELGASIGYASGDYSEMCTTGYNRYQYVGNHEENHNTLLLIPFHDAEAAYLWGNINTREAATVTGGYCEGLNQTGFFAWRSTEVFSDGMGGYTYYQYYQYAGGDGTHLAVNNTAQPDYENTTDRTTVAKLVTRSGAYDFSPPVSMTPFFSGSPFVEQTFYTNSAAVGSAVYGHGAYNLEGFPNLFISPPPFIGWA